MLLLLLLLGWLLLRLPYGRLCTDEKRGSLRGRRAVRSGAPTPIDQHHEAYPRERRIACTERRRLLLILLLLLPQQASGGRYHEALSQGGASSLRVRRRLECGSDDAVGQRTRPEGRHRERPVWDLDCG